MLQGLTTLDANQNGVTELAELWAYYTGALALTLTLALALALALTLTLTLTLTLALALALAPNPNQVRRHPSQLHRGATGESAHGPAWEPAARRH